ncbi:uncharacterized protein LOC110719927 [Chenopodium quinoa]|uniref:uncharacterized protein LOC110719927 n=1 Tax=Chenopodium quinoa TaxID=63459 RepID=UPI000B778F6A|nr:uncharacterized protein LOC110719927 [Chenopodium quinoa]
MIEKRQFTGGKFENPHEHLKEFLKYCDTIKINGVSQEYIRLKMFPFSLMGAAEHWLNKDVPPGSLTTWNEVTTAFLGRFYNHKKTAEARSKIQSFRQRGGESLCEAWERFKELQRQCPHHGIPNWQVLQTFYGGLSPQSKTSLDAGAGGPIMNKREDEVESIIEEVVRNYEDWYEGEREATSSKGTVHSVEQTNAITNLSNQMAKMAKQMEEFMKSSSQNASSPSPKGGHGMNPSTSSPSNYNAMPPGCMFCDICGGYDHNSQQCMSISEGPPPHENDDNVEDVNAMNFVPREGNNGMRPNWNQNPNRVNPKSMYAITTRSGKILESELNVEKSPDVRIGLEVEDESSRKNEILEGSAGKNERGEKEKEKELEKESTKDQTSLPLNLQPRNERLPFPQRFARSRLDVQFGKFLDVVKSLHVSIPFVDAMKEMPHYSKFLKDLLNGRREVETVSLTANCSAILSSASVSLMPFSVYQKLNVGNLSPTNITLQLADRSTKLPIGKVEDIPLRVGKFTFPVDFYVLEMDEDERIPIILGRPFLATSKAIIDVKEGKMTLKVDNDSIEFDLNKVMRQPSSDNECYRIDTIENLMNEFRYPYMHASNDLLENVLLNENEVGDQKEMQLYEEMLDEKEETTPDQEMPQPYEVFQVEEEEISNGKVAPKVELKPLPSGLRYVFLDVNDTFPVIINANLTEEQTSSLLNVLKMHRKALGYTLDDLKGISPSLCMHKIDLEEGAKPCR